MVTVRVNVPVEPEQTAVEPAIVAYGNSLTEIATGVEVVASAQTPFLDVAVTHVLVVIFVRFKVFDVLETLLYEPEAPEVLVFHLVIIPLPGVKVTVAELPLHTVTSEATVPGVVVASTDTLSNTPDKVPLVQFVPRLVVAIETNSTGIVPLGNAGVVRLKVPEPVPVIAV